MFIVEIGRLQGARTEVAHAARESAHAEAERSAGTASLVARLNIGTMTWSMALRPRPVISSTGIPATTSLPGAARRHLGARRSGGGERAVYVQRNGPTERVYCVLPTLAG